tara:strand:+ start:826 stop:1086 length:261 start_codon:yes stop_codon:yes gene_type:complete
LRSLPRGLHPDQIRDLLVDRVVFVVEVVVLAIELDLTDWNPLHRRASPHVPVCFKLYAGELRGGLGDICPQVLHGGGEELRWAGRS